VYGSLAKIYAEISMELVDFVRETSGYRQQSRGKRQWTEIEGRFASLFFSAEHERTEQQRAAARLQSNLTPLPLSKVKFEQREREREQNSEQQQQQQTAVYEEHGFCSEMRSIGIIGWEPQGHSWLRG
jgi:hypothetical protein